MSVDMCWIGEAAPSSDTVRIEPDVFGNSLAVSTCRPCAQKVRSRIDEMQAYAQRTILCNRIDELTARQRREAG